MADTQPIDRAALQAAINRSIKNNRNKKKRENRKWLKLMPIRKA